MIQSHYIKPNDTTRVPQRFIYLDTESITHAEGITDVQTWRCGVTAFDGWDDHKKEAKDVEWDRWTNPDDLWNSVSKRCRRRCRTVLVAHNLAFDLRISRAFYLLPALGWSISRLGLHEKAMSVTWKREDGATLVCIDSLSWLPMGLDKIAQTIGTQKEPLPANDSLEGWWERCEQDVRILRDACRQLWSMVTKMGLGNWQRTGAGMSWANWRHLHYTHRVVVHDDPEARKAEIAASYTGRCEAWQWGRFVGGPYTEWDLPLAYPRVARDNWVPVALLGRYSTPKLSSIFPLSDGQAWLCKATVNLIDPILPVQSGEGFHWPIGEVSGWYWDVELNAAREAGAEIVLEAAYRYRTQPALRDWATWVIGVAEGTEPGFTSIQRAAIKHWGRALIGRFAVKYRTWDYWGEGCNGEVGLNTIIDRETGESTEVLLLGGESYIASDELYGADACPFIQGYIQAVARVRLWEIIRTAGAKEVVYLDTDSVITTPLGSKRLRAATRAGDLYGLRPKRVIQAMTIYGPRQLVIDGANRLAGIPSGATHVEALKYTGQRWEGVEAALGANRADSVVLTPVTWKVSGVDRRRTHLINGLTIPHELVAS